VQRQRQLYFAGSRRIPAHLSARQIERVGHDHGGNEAERAKKIRHVDDAPIAQQLPGRHLRACPRHHDKGIPGEELGASDDDKDQSEGERQAAEEADRSERVAGARRDNHEEQGAEADEQAGEPAKHGERKKGKSGLRYPGDLHPARDLRRFECVDPGGMLGHVHLILLRSPQLRYCLPRVGDGK
jgi:hypothetical protein